MRAFGEAFPTYKPPIDTKTIRGVIDRKKNGNPRRVLNFLTPHQKWGIHSSFSDTQMMLTLSRGGPCVWPRPSVFATTTGSRPTTATVRWWRAPS
jgi:nitrate reductase alpha subunit